MEGDTPTITPTQANDITANNAKVSFPEAPSDGKQYARKNGAWDEVLSGGDMVASVYDPDNVQDNAFDYANFLGTWQIKGSTTTINLSSDVDNLDLDGYNIVYFTSSSSDRRITGIKAPASGVNRLICLVNNNASRRIRIIGNSGSSLANNRFVLRGNAGSRNLDDYQITFAFYNHTLNKWQITRIG